VFAVALNSQSGLTGNVVWITLTPQ